MKTISLAAVAVALISTSLAPSAFGQAAAAPKAAATPAPAIKPIPPADELEAKFKTTLSNATFTGRWAPIADGVMGDSKDDSYKIASVSKVGGSSWIVNAKMKYNDREFVVPIPVQVRWAGDTAMIIVDDLKMPGGNRAYSARVLVHDQTYAGTWSGGEHKGLLNGIITNEK